jgi:hypothetical protein
MQRPTARLAAVLLLTLSLLAVARASSPASAATPAPASPPALARSGAPLSFTGRVPVRVVDTREGLGGIRLAAGETRKVSLSPYLPKGAGAAAVSVVAVDAAAEGYLTVWNCANPRPVVSHLNYPTSQARAAGTVVRLSSGSFCVFSLQAADVVVDLQGAYTTTVGSLLRPVGPTRLFDSRDTRSAVLPAGTTSVVTVPAATGTVTGAVVNLTSVGAERPGWVTIHPCGGSRPFVSSLNVRVVAPVANSVHVQVPADGRLCVYNQTPTHVVVDLAAVFTTARDGLWYQPAVPIRLLDTRDGTGGWRGPLDVGQVVRIPTGTLRDAAAVFVTVTAVTPKEPSYLTAWSGDGAPPWVSNLNVDVAGGTMPNGALAGLAPDRTIGVLSQRGAHELVVDLSGWYLSQPFSDVPPPPVSTSRYAQTPDVSPLSDPESAGCVQAAAEQGGLVVIPFGRQDAEGTRIWFTPNVRLYADIQAISVAWVRGLARCADPGERFVLALGTSNSGGVNDFNGAAGGTRWAQLVEDVAAAVADQDVVEIAASNDVEPGWGPPSQVRAWYEGYLAGTTRTLFNTGSADGCPPQWWTTTSCANGWSVGDVFWAATGASPQVQMVPEIYTPNGFLAGQWARISRWGVDSGVGPLRVGGVLSEEGACAQVGECTGLDNPPATAWGQLWGALNADPATAQTPSGYLTDIRWGW